MRYSCAYLTLIFCATPLFAHRLLLTCKVAGDTVHVEAYYEDDTPAQNARVALLLAEKIITSGRTDERGVWVCPKPTGGDYLVLARTEGHTAKENLLIPSEQNELTTPENSEVEVQSERVAKTQTQWWRLGLGLLVISLGYWVWRRLQGRSASASH